MNNGPGAARADAALAGATVSCGRRTGPFKCISGLVTRTLSITGGGYSPVRATRWLIQCLAIAHAASVAWKRLYMYLIHRTHISLNKDTVTY